MCISGCATNIHADKHDSIIYISVHHFQLYRCENRVFKGKLFWCFEFVSKEDGGELATIL